MRWTKRLDGNNIPQDGSRRMKIRELHSWEIKPVEAAALQRSLAGQIDVPHALMRWDLVAGADISYNRFSPTIYVAVVVIRATDGAIVETQEVIQDTTFPYIPGFLSFREAPAVLEAFRRLQTEPDVVMVDGQALAHPRRFGLGCHLGLWLDRPMPGLRRAGSSARSGNRAGARARWRRSRTMARRLARWFAPRTVLDPCLCWPGTRSIWPAPCRWCLAPAGATGFPSQRARPTSTSMPCAVEML